MLVDNAFEEVKLAKVDFTVSLWGSSCEVVALILVVAPLTTLCAMVIVAHRDINRVVFELALFSLLRRDMRGTRKTRRTAMFFLM